MRPIAICTGQFGDVPLPELCRSMRDIGYDGLEVSAIAHLHVDELLADDAAVETLRSTLAQNHMRIYAISAHGIGQLIGDDWEPRLDRFVPNSICGQPEAIRAWAVRRMQQIAEVASKLGVTLVTGFLGSPIWKYWYSYPMTTPAQVEDGFQKIRALWDPIFDVFDRCGVRFAFEPHPAEIAFDYYTTERLLETFAYRPTLGLNFDPSHLFWQGMNPCVFLRDFAPYIYGVHLKDAKIRLDGKSSLLGSHLHFGQSRRGWDFVSLGHGDIDFEEIIRELNDMNYAGALTVEWEDCGMDRFYGAKDAWSFAQKLNYDASKMLFDTAEKIKR